MLFIIISNFVLKYISFIYRLNNVILILNCYDFRALGLAGLARMKFLASDFIKEHNIRHTPQIQISILAIVSFLRFFLFHVPIYERSFRNIKTSFLTETLL